MNNLVIARVAALKNSPIADLKLMWQEVLQKAHLMSLLTWQDLHHNLKILHYYEHFYYLSRHPMSTNTLEGEILTIKEIADYLKVTERTIYRLAAAKQMPAFKIGGSWRFSRQNIDSWIKQQSIDSIDNISKSEDLR